MKIRIKMSVNRTFNGM